MFEEELAAFLGRFRYGRDGDGGGDAKGYRHGHRERQLTGTFGTETVRVPRARVADGQGQMTEWRSKALPRYRRLTKKAEALIAAVYLSGTNTRRVKRALFGLFEGAVSKDVVSRAWRKVKVDWDAWCVRNLADEDIVRLILIPLADQRAIPPLLGEPEGWLEVVHEQAHGPVETRQGFGRFQPLEAAVSDHASHHGPVLGGFGPLDQILVPRTLLDMGLIVLAIAKAAHPHK